MRLQLSCFAVNRFSYNFWRMVTRAKRKPTASRWTPARIRALRHAMDESQEEFCRHFRVTPEAVRIWEQGRGRPSGPATVILDALEQAVRACAVTPS